MCIHVGAFDLLQWVVESKLQNAFENEFENSFEIKEKKRKGELENKRVSNVCKSSVLETSQKFSSWKDIWIWFGSYLNLDLKIEFRKRK